MRKFGTKRGIPFSGNVLITGTTGFLGWHMMKELREQWPFANLIDTHGSAWFDLTHPNHARTMFNSIENNHGPIRTVIHMAALSGGRFVNERQPATFMYQNLMMGMNMIENCAGENKVVQKMVTFMGACSLPDQPDRTTPFTEDDMWDGLPEASALGYSFAKKALLIAAWAYEKEFGFKTIILMPSNMIGEGDNCDLENSHVVTALINKFVEARDEGYSNVVIRGTGRALRDWVYAGDVAYLTPKIYNIYDEVGKPLSISSGVGIPISEIAEMIAKATGYTGSINYDKSFGDGQLYKVISNKKLLDLLAKNNIEWTPTPVEEAISRTVEWYEKRVWKK